MRARITAALSALLVSFLLTSIGFSQNAHQSPEDLPSKLAPLSAKERVDLIAKLDDRQVRELLLQSLSQAGAASAPKD